MSDIENILKEHLELGANQRELSSLQLEYIIKSDAT